MVDSIKVFLLILSALFPIVNPLGGSPIFLDLTKKYETAARRALSWRVAWNSFLLMVGSYFVGSHILEFFGLSLPVVQVGGGLVVVSMGWALLMKREVRDAKDEPARATRHVTTGVLSPHHASDGRAGIDLRRGNVRRQYDESLWDACLDDHGRARRHGPHRDQCVLVLWVCGSAGSDAW